MHCVGGPDAFIPCDLHCHQTKAAGCTWQADAPVAIAADAFDKVNAYKQLSAQVPSSGGGGTDPGIGNNQTCAQASPHVSVCELNFVQGSPTVPLCVCACVCMCLALFFLGLAALPIPAEQRPLQEVHGEHAQKCHEVKDPEAWPHFALHNCFDRPVSTSSCPPKMLTGNRSKLPGPSQVHQAVEWSHCEAGAWVWLTAGGGCKGGDKWLWIRVGSLSDDKLKI